MSDEAAAMFLIDEKNRRFGAITNFDKQANYITIRWPDGKREEFRYDSADEEPGNPWTTIYKGLRLVRRWATIR